MATSLFGSSNNNRTSTSLFGGSSGSKRTTTPATGNEPDLQTLEGLQAYAAKKGFDVEVKEKKLSFLQRLGRGLSALEPVNAFYQSQYEGKNFATEYLRDIFAEAGSAITGREMNDAPKKTFKDVLLRNGMKDRQGKLDLVDVLGLTGDILTDPGTYIGGSLVKGAGKLLGVGGRAVKGIAKVVAPQKVAAAEAAFGAAKDALGRAFVPAYGASKYARNAETVVDDVLKPFVDEAVRVGDPSAFAKTVTKEMLQGEDPVSFFNRVTKPKELGTDLAEYKNIIAGSAERIGREQIALFDGLSNQAKDDLVDGLFTARRNFGTAREELIQKGLSYEDATKAALSKFDTMLPEQMFKEPETIRFFTQTLLPELEKSKAKFAAATDMQEDLLMNHFFPAIKKSNIQDFNKSIRVGSEGYLKRYKGILQKEDIITDPVEAYARRAFELEKNGITRDTLNQWVDDYGLPLGTFKNADEAFGQGYRPLKEKGMFGKELGWIKENDYRFLKDTFDPSFKAVEDLARSLGFDAVTSLFKKSVTGLFAPFHIRNYMSGVIQNYQALGPRALNPTTIAKGNALAMDILKEGDEAADTLIKIGGKSFNKKEIIDAYRKRFGISSQYISDFGLETQEQLTKKESKLNPFYYAKRVGNFVETQQKATAIVAAIQKGYDLPQALKMAEKAGFDYSKMTAFEKNIMRRIIPFYSFSRKNLELQLRTLASNPERLATLTKAGRALGTPQGLQEEGETLLPEWMRNRIVANFGESEYGLPQVLAGFGLPLEETADLANDGLLGILSRVNPLFKVPLERATGKDFFRDQDIKDVYSADEYAEAPEIVKNFLKIQEVKKPVIRDGKQTGEERTVYRADPERLHIMRNLFTSRGVSYLHTLFGDSELSDQARVIKSLTGMRPYEVDENATKFFEDRDNYRDFIDVMAQLNLVKTFERAYIPKTEEEKRIEEAKKKASKKKGESLFQ